MKLSQTAEKVLGGIVRLFQAGPEGIEVDGVEWVDGERRIVKRQVTLSDVLPVPVLTPDAERPMDRWSFCNRMAVYMGGTGDARGMRQWRAVGRKVRKGAKALYILAPLVREYEDEDADGQKVTRTAVYGFRGVPVFRYEDTEGEPLTFNGGQVPAAPPLGKVAEAWGIKIQYAPGGGRVLGSWRQGAREITLHTEAPHVLYHELAHAADGDIQGKLKPGQHEVQEAVAELAACALAKLYGEDITGFAFRYLKGYAKDGDAATLAAKVLSRTGKVVDRILAKAAEVGEAPQVGAEVEAEAEAIVAAA